MFKVDFTDNKEKVLNAFYKQVEDGLIAIGATAEGYAKDNCPVDTGRLKGSITFDTNTMQGKPEPVEGSDPDDHKPKAQPEENSVYIGTNVHYAAKMEFIDMEHTIGQAHYLRDAATTHNDEYKKLMQAAISQ